METPVIDYVKFAQLPVFDQDRALAFYRDRLGLVVTQDRPYQGDLRWIELAIPGARTGIWFAARESEALGQQPAMILIVKDVRATFDALLAKGVEFVQPPTEAPWSPAETFAVFRDTEGNMVMLGDARD